MVFSKVKTEYRKLDHTNIEEDIINSISKVTIKNKKLHFLFLNP
jgi:hypothetical protein